HDALPICLLGRTVSVDWIGVALALVGIGIALLPLADQFETLRRSRRSSFDSRWPAVVPCTHLEANSARREAKPRSCAARADQVADDDEPAGEPSRTAKGSG